MLSTRKATVSRVLSTAVASTERLMTCELPRPPLSLSFSLLALLFSCARGMVVLDAGVVTLLDAGSLDAGPALFAGLQFDQLLGGRTYHFYAPPRSVTERRPLVLLLHGNGGSADQIIGRNGKAAPFKRWLDIASRERLFLLIPNGTASEGASQGWNDCRGDATSNPTVDDVSFLLSALQEVTPQGVDVNQVFATGISNGGHLSLRLAIEHPEVFHAVAPVVATMPAASECAAPTKPVSVFFLNGTEDPILPYDGGFVSNSGARGSVLSTRASVDVWRSVNGVTEPEIERALPDIAKDDGCTLTDFSSRSAWPTVRLLRGDKGGHTEPSLTERYGSAFLLVVGRQNKDLEMADEVWTFFKSQAP